MFAEHQERVFGEQPSSACRVVLRDVVGCPPQQLAGGALASSRGQQSCALQVDVGRDIRRGDEDERLLEHRGSSAEPPGLGGHACRG